MFWSRRCESRRYRAADVWFHWQDHFGIRFAESGIDEQGLRGGVVHGGHESELIDAFVGGPLSGVMQQRCADTMPPRFGPHR